MLSTTRTSAYQLTLLSLIQGDLINKLMGFKGKLQFMRSLCLIFIVLGNHFD